MQFAALGSVRWLQLESLKKDFRVTMSGGKHRNTTLLYPLKDKMYLVLNASLNLKNYGRGANMSEFTIKVVGTNTDKTCMCCANLGDNSIDNLSIYLCKRKKIDVDMWQDYDCEYFTKDNDN
jgi:hypothetical protein